MRNKEKQRLIGKINEASDDTLGESLYFRPYRKDLEMIGEISRASGEKKSAVAQKLIRLALRGKSFEFTAKDETEKKLDWLINNEKHKFAKPDVFDARFERLEDAAREMDVKLNEALENSRITKILAAEIYCIASISMSFLNQIFTRLIEYFSPAEIERKNSQEVAGRNILFLLEHALEELAQLAEHHALEIDARIEPEMLYLFTKIERVKERILSNKMVSGQE